MEDKQEAGPSTTASAGRTWVRPTRCNRSSRITSDPTRYDANSAVTLNQHAGNYLNAICQRGSRGRRSRQHLPVQTDLFGNPFNGIVAGKAGQWHSAGRFADHKYAELRPRALVSPTTCSATAKTAIRGGAGIFYERIRQNVNSSPMAFGNPPLSYTPTIFGQRIDNLNPGLVTGIRTPVDLNSL